MFDSFAGLPLHMLIVHLTVVALPLGAPAVAAVYLRPAWRDRFATAAALISIALLVLTFVTARAGYALQSKVDGTLPINDHRQYAVILIWVVLAFTAVSVATWAAARVRDIRSLALTGLAAITAALAVAVIGMTIVVGHSGTASRWSGLF